MNNKAKRILFLLLPALLSAGISRAFRQEATLFTHAQLINGRGGPATANNDILVVNGRIRETGQHLKATGAKVIDLSGKTVMPAMLSTHVHVGTLKDTTTLAGNYTLDNIRSQLQQYQAYGVTNILAMGTDRPILFASGFRDSSQAGQLPGARLHSAGYGFGVEEGAPPVAFAMDRVFRPITAAQVAAQMDSLARLRPTVVKLWLDDFGGKLKKMDPAVYKAIITAAHKHHLCVVAHVYYLSDARKLVADGVDVLGHSIRDSVIDDALLKEMKARNVVYIPTLSLDKYSYVYGEDAPWINDPFFKVSLQPGVYQMITSPSYRNSLRNTAAYTKNKAAFETALRNLKRIYDAGILVSFGTDSGAIPIRAQGFSEHLELELLTAAGLTPLQAIGLATSNAARVLREDKDFGTLEKGKIADFIVLNQDPLQDIRNTRSIESVYKAGKLVSNGPLAQ